MRRGVVTVLLAATLAVGAGEVDAARAHEASEARAGETSAARAAGASGARAATGWSRLSTHTVDNLDHLVTERARERDGTPARRVRTRGGAAARNAARDRTRARKRQRRRRSAGRITRRPVRGFVPAGWLRPTAPTAPSLAGSLPGTTLPGTATPIGSTPPASGATPTLPPSGPDVPDLPSADPRSVSVASTEFAFSLSQTHVKAGRVRIQFDNSRGEDPHSLAARGTDLATAQTAAHRVTTVAYDFSPGTYTLYCPILDHEARGMKATLTVDP